MSSIIKTEIITSEKKEHLREPEHLEQELYDLLDKIISEDTDSKK